MKRKFRPEKCISSVEGGNGELGFYLISDGGRAPYRLHFRRPCFIYYQAYSEMTKGAHVERCGAHDEQPESDCGGNGCLGKYGEYESMKSIGVMQLIINN